MEIKSEEYQEYLKEKFLNIHEAAGILDISEEELWKLVHEHKVQTHNVAGTFLRFRQKDIEDLKTKWRIARELFPEQEKYFSHHNTVPEVGLRDKLRDFWYFNDFYVLCSLAIAVLLYFILSSQ